MAVQNDYAEISAVLKKFVSHWEKGGSEDLSDCVVREPFAYFGPFGNAYELQTLSHFLSLPQKRPSLCRMETVNETALIKGDTAFQYAALVGYFEEEKNHIAFGGSFANTLVKTKKGWRLETIRFELRNDDSEKLAFLENGKLQSEKGGGDIFLLQGWKTPAARIRAFLSQGPGQSESVILAETDAPWFLAPERERVLSDEDAVKNLFTALCFGYDYSSMFLIRNILSEDAVLGTRDGAFHGRDIIGYLRKKRQAHAESFHAGYFDQVSTSADSAGCDAILLDPDVFCEEKAEKDLLSAFSGRHLSYRAVKTEGTWKLKEIRVQEGEKHVRED